MNRNRLTFIAIFFFLATQFISIFGSMWLIASLAEVENFEDISVEHVVPLDPFLAAGHLQGAFHVTGHAEPLRILGILSFLLVSTIFVVPIGFFLRHWEARRQRVCTTNLWLLKRVLLI